MNKYQMVHKIGDVLTHSTSTADGLNQITRLVATSLNAWCSLYSYDAWRQQITMVSAYGANGTHASVDTTFDVQSGLVGLAIRKKSIINLDDAEVHLDFHPVPGYEDTPETMPHGALVAPLSIGDQVIGAIVLSRKQKAAFSPKIVGLIEEITPPLALFIVNSRLMMNSSQDNNYFAIPDQEAEAASRSDLLLTGTPITGGVVFGNAVKISGVNELLELQQEPQPVNTTPEEIQKEKDLLEDAMASVRDTCRKTAEELSATLAEADCNIFEMHAMMVDDPTLQNTIVSCVEQGHSITAALAATLRVFSERYKKIQDDTLRERLYDIKDVLLNLKNAADNLRSMRDRGVLTSSATYEPKNAIIVAKELLPSQLVSFPLKKLAGIICEEGGSTSHVAILARALQITMMVGVPSVFAKIRPKDGVLLDCDTGKCLVRPSMAMIRNYSIPLKLGREQRIQDFQKSPRKPIPAATADGEAVTFASNLALLCEIPANRYYGIGEIGLYRTEFMFMLKSELPSEGEQFAHFRKIIEGAGNIPITIRLLDVGGDKPIPYLDCWQQEANPALGWRGLRFLLSNPQVLQPHLRAILRAAAFGKISILVPMVADLFDLMQFKEALAKAENDLKQQGIPFSTDYKLGIMLEIPSAVHALKEMLPYINFVSIGTNDLVQFMFAVDRGNQQVRRWYRQCNPIILRVIHEVCNTMKQYPNKYVTLCGELAGNRRMLPVLLGAGLRRLSMTPSRIPALRDAVSRYTIPECETLFKEVMATCHTEMDVINFLKRKGIE